MLLTGTILFPILFGILVSILKLPMTVRKRLYAAVVVITDILGILSIYSAVPVTWFTLTGNTAIAFSPDAFGRFFLTAVMILYTAVCFYAFEYMNKEERPEVFFAFFLVSFGMMISVSMAGNLITMYMCFEMVTLTTFPLVLHELSKSAVAAGLKYLFYSIAGALLGLFAVLFIYSVSNGDTSFVFGGFLTDAITDREHTILLIACMAGIFGFGTKAGMYPMHGWLPTAHPIAPAPASALLSGIVAKAGVLALIRLVYYAVGPAFLAGTWVQYTWMICAMLTILMGSTMAFHEKIMKKRLAYSSISQISYILLGLSFLSTAGFEGGLLHLMQHMASKGCLFLAAGVFIHQLKIRQVSDLKGIGKRMPIVLWCFTIASLSLVGIPPLGGFLSKWFLAGAALNSGMLPFSVIAPIVLLISALLTAGYLLPVVADGFFPGHEHHEPGKEHHVQEGPDLSPAEPSPLMYVPMICLCLVSLIVGIWGQQILVIFGL